MRQVAQDMIQERIETIKPLSGDANELYEIVKDKDTGEHYLHYAYKHLHVSDGSEENFHQLLPLDSDDVLGIMFSNQGYSYPEHWKIAFLRNGPDQTYVWFDPSDIHEEDDKERKAAEMVEMLRQFKAAGQTDLESVKKLLDQIDKKLNDGEV
jgi:hypothetical protein